MVIVRQVNNPKMSTKQKGRLIVIEGAGGAGKTTQGLILADRLRKEGYPVFEISFPRYNIKPYGPIIKQYLNGEFGPCSTVDPRLASMPFINDRLLARETLNQNLNEGKIIVATRYTASNMAYQMVKLPLKKQEGFIKWLDEVEYTFHQIPREDLLIFQYLSAENSLKMINHRANEGCDGHEQTLSYIQDTVSAYHKLVELYPHWQKIDCSDLKSKTGIKTENEIHQAIWDLVYKVIK